MGGRPFATLPGRPPTELTSIFTYSLSFTLVALDLTIGEIIFDTAFQNLISWLFLFCVRVPLVLLDEPSKYLLRKKGMFSMNFVKKECLSMCEIGFSLGKLGFI